jgi:hypothetical protein
MGTEKPMGSWKLSGARAGQSAPAREALMDVARRQQFLGMGMGETHAIGDRRNPHQRLQLVRRQ